MKGGNKKKKKKKKKGKGPFMRIINLERKQHKW